MYIIINETTDRLQSTRLYTDVSSYFYCVFLWMCLTAFLPPVIVSLFNALI